MIAVALESWRVVDTLAGSLTSSPHSPPPSKAIILKFQFLIFYFLIFNSQFLILNFQFSILAGSTTPKHFFSNKDWILPKVKQPLCVKSIRIIFSATRQKRPDKNVVIVRCRNSIVKRLVSLKEETPLNNKLIYYLVEQIWAYFVILQLIFPLF